jgi:signal peptidase I
MADDTTTRYPIVALFLSFFTPGLGQFYNNQVTKATVVLALYVSAMVLVFTPIPKSFFGFSIMALLWIGSYLYSILESTVRAYRMKRIIRAPYQRWYSYLVIIVLFQALNFWSFTLLPLAPIKTFRNATVTMEPTIVVGDLFVVDKGFYSRHSIAQGDLAVFKYADEPTASYVHRCLATAGQTVVIRNRIPSVDGKPAWAPGYHRGLMYPILPADSVEPNISPPNAGNGDNYGPVVVPQGKCFMLGDNIANCLDSRYRGFVDLNAITGKPLFIYWSSDFARIGLQLR